MPGSTNRPPLTVKRLFIFQGAFPLWDPLHRDAGCVPIGRECTQVRAIKGPIRDELSGESDASVPLHSP